MEAVGYIGRCISVQNDADRPVYVLQFSLLVLAPVMMAAAYYVIFGRIVFLVIPREARTLRLIWVPPRFITPLFVGFDVVALFLQLVGAVVITSVDPTSTNASNKINTGKRVAQIGVVIQLLAFGLFTITAIRFNFTSKRFRGSTYERQPGLNIGRTSPQGEEHKEPRNSYWPALLRIVNSASICILVCIFNFFFHASCFNYRECGPLSNSDMSLQIRSVFRLVQFTQGPQGYTSTHEWCMYVFDTLPIYPCVAFFIYWHPANYLPHLEFRLPKHAR